MIVTRHLRSFSAVGFFFGGLMLPRIAAARAVCELPNENPAGGLRRARDGVSRPSGTWGAMREGRVDKPHDRCGFRAGSILFFRRALGASRTQEKSPAESGPREVRPTTIQRVGLFGAPRKKPRGVGGAIARVRNSPVRAPLLESRTVSCFGAAPAPRLLSYANAH